MEPIAPAPKHVNAVTELECQLDVLLHGCDGNTPIGQCADVLPKVLGDERRQSADGLVQQKYLGVAHERATYSQHVALATAQLPGGALENSFQIREQRQHALQRASRANIGADLEILLNGQ